MKKEKKTHLETKRRIWPVFVITNFYMAHDTSTTCLGPRLKTHPRLESRWLSYVVCNPMKTLVCQGIVINIIKTYLGLEMCRVLSPTSLPVETSNK